MYTLVICQRQPRSLRVKKYQVVRGYCKSISVLNHDVIIMEAEGYRPLPLGPTIHLTALKTTVVHPTSSCVYRPPSKGTKLAYKN